MSTVVLFVSFQPLIFLSSCHLISILISYIHAPCYFVHFLSFVTPLLFCHLPKRSLSSCHLNQVLVHSLSVPVTLLSKSLSFSHLSIHHLCYHVTLLSCQPFSIILVLCHLFIHFFTFLSTLCHPATLPSTRPPTSHSPGNLSISPFSFWKVLSSFTRQVGFLCPRTNKYTQKA